MVETWSSSVCWLMIPSLSTHWVSISHLQTFPTTLWWLTFMTMRAFSFGKTKATLSTPPLISSLSYLPTVWLQASTLSELMVLLYLHLTANSEFWGTLTRSKVTSSLMPSSTKIPTSLVRMLLLPSASLLLATHCSTRVLSRASTCHILTK